MAEIKLENVGKVYPGGVSAVESLNLEVADKEFLILVGPSGCGKSTVLRMIAGLEEISSGKIYIGGELVNDIPAKDRDIAMVFQSYALYPHMTVYQNMAYGLKLRKTPRDEIDVRVHKAAGILEIEHLLDRKPKALSGGERQRVALGRAIVRHPSVFLFDEPLSNLDAKLRASMRAEIKKLHDRLGATFIYVTHDQTEAMTMGDRIVVLKGGLLQQADTPQNTYNHPGNIFTAGFIGSPPMNMLDGTVELKGDNLQISLGNDSIIPSDTDTIQKLAEHVGERVSVGIRPENLQICKNYEEPSCLTATMEMNEALGSECYLYLSYLQSRIIARVAANTEFTPGTVVKLKPELNKICLFDSKTGNALI